MSRYKEYIEYYKRKLERNMNDEITVQHVFEKLSKTEFPVPDLLNTGIYRTVRAICKSAGEFADKALPLYNKWKQLILAEQNEQNKSLPVPPKAPAPSRVEDTQDVSKNMLQSVDMKNGYNDMGQGHSFSYTETDSLNKSSCNAYVNDGGSKAKSSNPTQLPPNTFPFSSFNNTNDSSSKAKSSAQPPVNTFQPFNNNFCNSNDTGYKIKSSNPPPPPVNKFQPFTNFSNSNDDGYSSKSSVPAQSSVNTFQPFSNFTNSSQSSVHNVKTENPIGLNASDFSANFDSNLSNPYSSPHSSSSQNPLDIGTPGTSSPSKIGRIPDPYTIEMKEGMFRVVKSKEGLTPDIIRVRRLYNQEDEHYDIEPIDDSKLKSKSKPIIKQSEQVDKSDKNSKVVKERSADKTSSSKPKSQDTSVKESRVEKSALTADRSAIEKSKKVKEGKYEVPKTEKHDKHFSPHKSSKSSRSSPMKSSSKGSPVVKYSSKGSPSAKATSKGSPVKSTAKGSPPIKSSTKDYPKSSKGSPMKSYDKISPFSMNHSSPCDTKKAKPALKDCDKKTSKVLHNDAAESFISSKKERTSVYSGKKTLQEVASLSHCCIRVLQKNIEAIRYTHPVPYDVLKPVLTHCSPSQLRRLEENNPYLMQHTDEIWKIFCQRLYRDVKPHSAGSWRELYRKVKEDQNKKLKDITATISASRQRTAPERQMKLTESPERPRSKKMRYSAPEPREAMLKPSKEVVHNSSVKEHNTGVHKLPPKDIVPIKLSTKESISSAHKKTKKAPVAPLMSKVKKTIGFLAMHKK